MAASTGAGFKCHCANLIAHIAAWEAVPAEDEQWSYYHQYWLAALEDVLADSGTVHAHDVSARAHTLARRPSGHDHPHA